jgi:hypothetical protein
MKYFKVGDRVRWECPCCGEGLGTVARCDGDAALVVCIERDGFDGLADYPTIDLVPVSTPVISTGALKPA